MTSASSGEFPYYAIVTFGYPRWGTTKDYYRSLASTERDLREIEGGTMTTKRIVGCKTREQALTCVISGGYEKAVRHG